MPSTTSVTCSSQKAVSEYEHLNYVHSWKDSSLETDEEDTLPLKPVPTSTTSVFHPVSSEARDNQNSNNALSFKRSVTNQREFQMSDDSNLRPAIAIPVPFNWSPIKSNPSLWLTPDKGTSKTKTSGLASDNVLEPQDVNKIPLPLAWSPGMMVRPDPSLFVTPEKYSVAKPPVIKDNYAMFPSETKENYSSHKQTCQDKVSKEPRPTVRFDLPSASSGDDTVDSVVNNSLADVGSPITLRGSDLPEEATGAHWKPFSPPKAYHPEAYSDDSALDSSALDQQSRTDSSQVLQSTLSHTSTGSVKPVLPKPSQKVSKQPKRKLRKSVPAPPPKEGPDFFRSSYSQYDSKHPSSSIVRESKNKHISADYSYPFAEGAMCAEAESEHVFARPEYNSTLKVRQELDALRQQEVDVEKAFQSTLAQSEQKRTEINEKASVYTNRRWDQFNNLVDLDTSVESLCDRIVRMRTAQATRKKKGFHTKDKSTKKADKAPDLQEFFSPDLQHDVPDLSLPGVVPHPIKLMTAPDDVAFDLYRHNRVWSGINDL